MTGRSLGAAPGRQERPGPRRVLMTADAMGGVWTYVVELVAQLTGAGTQVVVATMGDEPSLEQRRSLEELPGVELRTSGFALEWMAHPWKDVEAAGRWLLGIAREQRPDVVHLNHLTHGHLPFGAPVVTVVHSCVPSWWRAVFDEEAPPRYDEYRRVVSRSLRGSGAVVAPSHAMLTEARRLYGRLPRGTVIENGRSAAPFRRAAADKERVLACGRLWDRAKNLAVLEAVAPRLPWPLRVAGTTVGPDGRDRRPRHVHALGRLSPENVAIEMSEASVFVHPALYEPFGLAPLEAALSGCPLVLGDIASLREVWGDAATFVSPTDADQITAALRELMRDAPLRRARGQAARARALQLKPARMAAGYERLYRTLMRRHASLSLLAECMAHSEAPRTPPRPSHRPLSRGLSP
jgi:glycogen synthase